MTSRRELLARQDAVSGKSELGEIDYLLYAPDNRWFADAKKT
jgi:hypothetical protein